MKVEYWFAAIVIAVPFIFKVLLPPIIKLSKLIAKVVLYISLLKFLNRH